MRYEVTLDARRVTVEVTPEGRFSVDDRSVAADVREVVRGWQWSVTVGGASHEITLVTREPMRIDVDGVELRAAVEDERSLRARRSTGSSAVGRAEIRAPMPGLLKAVHVKEGDVVERDARIATLEAMKMENELLAPIGGRVSRLAQGAGSKVEGGSVIVVISPLDGEAR